ncbi:coiled-coil domain-containing protein 173 isoform X2 [Salmo trutta]|uniref:coiled-coil domain-containing protein 173 isoform X2 n=1 Tax=Salmo trutta TaxID=8032 RepID=UPI00113161F4|nr:coiled-coil domain-containing protein 173-like isoform X2 [Salmo trutta]
MVEGVGPAKQVCLTTCIAYSFTFDASLAVEEKKIMQPPDLRQVTVLPKAEWLRIQGSLNQGYKFNESLKEATKQREAMHLRSKEVVKFWSNTIAGQRQKKLEAKRIREELEEEEKKQMDIEEAKYQAQKRKEAIEKAKTQQYYETDRVKGFHSALLLTEVLKEREAQIELKQRKQDTSKDVDKEIMAIIKRREDEALQKEQQKALQRKLDSQATAEDLKQQAKEHEMNRELEKLENKKEAEELQRLKELFLWEQCMQEQKKEEQKRNTMKAHMEHLSNRDIIRAIEAQKQEMEEQRRRLFANAKQKMVKLRKDKEEEMFREVQMHREGIMNKLAAKQQEQTDNEELIAKAIAQRDARQAQQQKEKDDKRTAMLNSIASHREAMKEEQEQKEREHKERAIDMLYAKKEADRIFIEKQHLKAQKIKEDGRTLQDIYIHQMAEKRAKEQHIRKQQQDFETKNAELIAVEEKQFQQYAKNVIDTATEAMRNIHPLRKAAREGIGGGLGPIFGGVRPSYLVQDDTGVQMPNYVGSRSQDVKELNETCDIQQSKKRLGFTW